MIKPVIRTAKVTSTSANGTKKTLIDENSGVFGYVIVNAGDNDAELYFDDSTESIPLPAGRNYNEPGIDRTVTVKVEVTSSGGTTIKTLKHFE